MNMKETITVKIPSVIKHVPREEMSKIPNCCGAYVIKVESGKLYVGSSKTLGIRILAHNVYNDPNISEEMVSVCYYRTDTHEEARMMEYWLIREINPQLNKTNNSDILKKLCGAKCSQSCETWDSPSKIIKFNVGIVEVCENIPETKLPELPKECGVYVITTKSDLQYVGSSTNVCSRIKEHNSLRGDNISEPIKSVNCYITENRNDAYILEYSKIRDLKPTLNKEFQEDAWKWKSAELKKHFEKNPKLVELFKEFSSCILSCFPEMHEVVRKGWITYQTSALKNILFVKFMKDYLQVDLKDEKKTIKDTSDFSWEIEPTQASTFHRRFKLGSAEEIDKALEIVTQAYNRMLK